MEADGVPIGLADEVTEEVTQMWKSILDAVIESFVATDPNVYLYWRCARLQEEEAEARAEAPVRDTTPARGLQVVRPQKEATI
jgi:hypothetical protein